MLKFKDNVLSNSLTTKKVDFAPGGCCCCCTCSCCCCVSVNVVNGNNNNVTVNNK